MLIGGNAYLISNLKQVTAEFQAGYKVRHNAITTFIAEKTKPIKLDKIIRRLCGELPVKNF